MIEEYDNKLKLSNIANHIVIAISVKNKRNYFSFF